MIFFFGLVAFLAAMFFSFHLRREFAFQGSKESILLDSGARCVVESKFEQHKGNYTHTIGIIVARGLELRVEPEGSFSRWLASLRIGRDIKTYNTMLDRDLLFESDDPRVASWLAADKRTHEIFRAIFELKPTRFVAHQGRIWLCFKGALGDFAFASKTDTAVLAQVAELLRQLGQCIPETLVGPSVISVTKRAKAMLLLAVSSGFVGLALLLGVAQLKSNFPALAQPWRFYGGAFGIAILTGLMLLWAAARWISDSARARIVLLELATMGLVGFVLSVGLTLAHVNLALANTPAVTEVVNVESVYERRVKRGNRYYVRLVSLADGTVEPAALSINNLQFYALERARRARVQWQMGYFGQLVVLGAPEPIAEEAL
jgi:hypothetical protein